jgi:hypothetical protein
MEMSEYSMISSPFNARFFELHFFIYFDVFLFRFR